MKKVIFFLFCSSYSFFIWAQHSLTTSENLPREGDRLVKQLVEYIDPGSDSLHTCWDFSDLKFLDPNYSLSYTVQGTDSIIGSEHMTSYYYIERGDSLFLYGYENPTTRMTHHTPELLLTFPFPYGRVFNGYFESTGTYCRMLHMHVQGKYEVRADSYGSLVLPEQDTLQHVLRIHTIKKVIERVTPYGNIEQTDADTLISVLNKDSIDYFLLTDSARIEVENWRWYAEGFRYPVFETIKSTVYKFSKPYEHFSTSFYYPPHEQYYELPFDSENQKRRDRAEEQKSREWNNAEKAVGKSGKGDGISYRYHVDNDNILRIDYSLENKAKVYFILYDLNGHQLIATAQMQREEGFYSESISLQNFPIGEYLLRIVANDHFYGEKILKR